MIFQDPLSSLHPFYRVGAQIVEAVQSHRDVSKAQARDRAIELLGFVGIPEPKRRFDSFPHEFSGGMRQRAMIAMALVNEPDLLIADEPTTALDVTVQAQILELIGRLKDELGMAVIIITHDLGVVAEMSDDVAVMYGGRIVERAPDGADLRRAGAPLHLGSAALDPAPGRAARRAARADLRPAAEPHHAAHRLLVSPALRLRAARPPHDRSGPRAAGRRAAPRGGLPAAGADAPRPVARAARRCRAGGRARRRGRAGARRVAEQEEA